MIPQELRDLPQWVCAVEDSKVPWRAYENAPASSSDPDTWAEYDTAQAMVELGYYDYTGFVFHNNGIVGIDIDTGYDEDGLLSPIASDILSACHSYTERSRSGRGFHILIHGYLPFDGRNNRKGVEIYQNRRYFIMTGDTLVFPPVIEDNQPAIDYVLNTYFPETRESNSLQRSAFRVYTPEWMLPEGGRVRLRPVYPRIPSGSRNLCLTSLAGMLHNQGYNKRQIYDELLYCNQVACDPSLDNRELKSIVNSVTRYKR
jgi:hypothetical protein